MRKMQKGVVLVFLGHCRPFDSAVFLASFYFCFVWISVNRARPSRIFCAARVNRRWRPSSIEEPVEKALSIGWTLERPISRAQCISPEPSVKILA